jgi:hypothetical protein
MSVQSASADTVPLAMLPLKVPTCLPLSSSRTPSTSLPVICPWICAWSSTGEPTITTRPESEPSPKCFSCTCQVCRFASFRCCHPPPPTNWRRSPGGGRPGSPRDGRSNVRVPTTPSEAVTTASATSLLRVISASCCLLFQRFNDLMISITHFYNRVSIVQDSLTHFRQSCRTSPAA